MEDTGKIPCPNGINQFDIHANWFLFCKKAQKTPLWRESFLSNIYDSILLFVISVTSIHYPCVVIYPFAL